MKHEEPPGTGDAYGPDVAQAVAKSTKAQVNLRAKAEMGGKDGVTAAQTLLACALVQIDQSTSDSPALDHVSDAFRAYLDHGIPLDRGLGLELDKTKPMRVSNAANTPQVFLKSNHSSISVLIALKLNKHQFES